MKKMNESDIRIEMAADKDVRKFIETLQVWFDNLSSEGAVSNRSICQKTGMDPSFFSRTINGRNGNPNLLTIAKIFRAMELRLEPHVTPISDIKTSLRNFSASTTYDEALWSLTVNGMSILIENKENPMSREAAPPRQHHGQRQWTQRLNTNSREFSPTNAE